MNLRPLGYEPSELPNCSTPRCSDHCTGADRSPLKSGPRLRQTFAQAVREAGDGDGVEKAATVLGQAFAPYRAEAHAGVDAGAVTAEIAERERPREADPPAARGVDQRVRRGDLRDRQGRVASTPVLDRLTDLERREARIEPPTRPAGGAG